MQEFKDGRKELQLSGKKGFVSAVRTNLAVKNEQGLVVLQGYRHLSSGHCHRTERGCPLSSSRAKHQPRRTAAEEDGLSY